MVALTWDLWAFQGGGDLLMIRRRDFLAGLGGAVARPLVAGAQQPALPLIGFLSTGAPATTDLTAFLRGLAEAGFIEGKNVAIEYRSGNASFVQMLSLATELVHRQVAVIVALGALSTVRAAMAATSTIPIIFAYGGDPVKNGFVAALNHPGGNVTGLISLSGELAAKRLDLLHKMIPRAKTVAFLSGDSTFITHEEQTSSMIAAGRALGLEVIVVECRSDRDFNTAFATIVQRQADAVVLGNFPFRNLENVITLAARYKIPAMYPSGFGLGGSGGGFAFGGGLMSYGADLPNAYRQLGRDYVGQILSGAKPADLPVQQPTKFKLVINLQTAKALGLDVPLTLLALADEVIK
jgi:putative tryptophan/tyrosine transport system substrate-binding protein